MVKYSRLQKLFKRSCFFWLWSFISAVIGYFILWVVMPHHYVYGALPRMYLYHWEHPVSFLTIPCFFFGVVAALFVDMFNAEKTLGRICITAGIIILTLLARFPFGGMLWHFFDMLAGYWPRYYWKEKLFIVAPIEGFEYGWAIILLSLPYSLFGILVCYILMAKAAKLLSLENDDRIEMNPKDTPEAENR